jgi:TetR/AcrR family fatty acid metabolism transcriptional regulator
MPTTEKRRKKSSAEEKKSLILHSAVRVFSQKGFHRCRISDIANQAGVAYGLVYHYFENKQEILHTIFEKNWGLLTKVIDTVEEQTDDLEQKLLLITSFMLDAYKLAPDIIQVMVMEIARSSKFLKKPKIEAFEKAFNRLARILSHHQETGEIATDLEPKLLAYCFFGILELLLTGYLLGTLQPKDGERHEAFKTRLVSIFLNGIRKPAE